MTRPATFGLTVIPKGNSIHMMCRLRTGQNHVRSTTFGWIDESGIVSKFCRQRRAKPSRSPYRVARADFEEAVKLRLGRIITLRYKTLAD